MKDHSLQQKEYNTVFGILSAFGILMIVAGHVDCRILTVGDLFPYYSFHVPLFLFISGYFYREKEEQAPLAYVKRKFCRLLLPYLLWNVFYGILAWALRAWGGFSLGGGLSLWNLFVEPFVSGYQFLYNFAAWFVPVLFVIEMMNLLLRLVLKKLHLNHEWLILAGTLAVGMTVVWLAKGGHVWGWYKTPGRILFLFPCFQMGQFYYRRLEKHDTLGNLPYFAVLLGFQLVLTLTCGGLGYSSVWVTGFANGPLLPYVTAVSGIAFWLRVSKILNPVLGKSRAVLYLGKNTYCVMMHHIFVFMLIKMALAAIAKGTGCFPDFDWEQYRGNIDYFYLVKGADSFKMVYVLAGTTLPLLLQLGIDRIKEKILG